VRLDIAHRAWVPVPVPGTTEVAAIIDDANVAEPLLMEARSGQQASKSTASNDNFRVIGNRGP